MRVYLMADFGKGPRVVARHRPQAALWDAYTKGARAWWLVEAESADAARKCIERHTSYDSADSIIRAEDGAPLGRVLANGGAK